MVKPSRSVRTKTMPVEGGAGRIRIRTGTPECNPTPEASTGRFTVFSNCKKCLHGEPHLTHSNKRANLPPRLHTRKIKTWRRATVSKKRHYCGKRGTEP